MSIWTLGHEELKKMNLHDRRKIIFSAMRQAKIMSKLKTKIFITLSIFVSVIIALYSELKGVPTLLNFIGVMILSGLLCMTIFIYYMKGDYSEFIEPCINNKETILGTPEERLKGERMRSLCAILNVLLISGILFIFTY